MDLWLPNFLKLFPEVTDILYLYILDQKVWYLLLLHILKFSFWFDLSGEVTVLLHQYLWMYLNTMTR